MTNAQAFFAAVTRHREAAASYRQALVTGERYAAAIFVCDVQEAFADAQREYAEFMRRCGTNPQNPEPRTSIGLDNRNQ